MPKTITCVSLSAMQLILRRHIPDFSSVHSAARKIMPPGIWMSMKYYCQILRFNNSDSTVNQVHVPCVAQFSCTST